MPIYLGHRTGKYVGDTTVPQDIKRRRRSVEDMLRRMGTPVVVKHRYNDLDFRRTGSFLRAARVQDVVADLPTDIYDQRRNYDPLSYGVGYVGANADGSPILWAENDPGAEFFDPNWDGFNRQTVDPNDLDTSFIWRRGVDGQDPPNGYQPAPKFRGYGPAYLTYIIMPDRAEDYFKSNVGGPLFKVQEAYAIAPFFPEINDNDLICPVILKANEQIDDLDGYGRQISTGQKYDRFEAKQTSPISMRGLDRSGRQESRYSDSWGNRHVINQTFEMDLLPYGNVAYDVELDR